MGKIYISTDAVLTLKSNINSKKNSCRDYSSRVYSIQNNLYWKVLNRKNIRSRLNSLRTRIDRQSALLSSYAQVLGTVNSNMIDTDNRLKGDAKKLTCKMNKITKVTNVCKNGSDRSRKIWGLDAREYSFIASLFGGGIGGPALSTNGLLRNWDMEMFGGPGSIGSASSVNGELKNWSMNAPGNPGNSGGVSSSVKGVLRNWSMDFLGNAGYAGGAVALGGEIVNIIGGKSTTLTKLETTKTIWSSWNNIGTDIKNMGKIKPCMSADTYKASWIKKIIGTNNFFDKTTGVASKASSWTTRFSNNLQKTTKKAVKGVGWISTGLTGVINAFENKEEYASGEITQGRAVAETITETAVDVATDVALTSVAAAAVGATAVALGATVAAPVVVVGAVAATGKLALDGVALWATGGEKDFSEVVSDEIIDAGEAIGKGIAKGAEKVGSAVSAALDYITPRWKFSFGF